MRPTSRAATLVFALAPLACGSEAESSDGWDGTVDTLASGTVVVRNGAASVWGAGDAWRLEEELRLGSMMDDGPEAFGGVRALLTDDDGGLYVLDSQAQEIRVFGPDGRHLRTIGRKGEGPGELKDAIAMGWGPAGELRVVDLGNARISDFTPEGDFLTGHPQRGGFFMYPWPGTFEPDGSLITVAPVGRDGEFRPVLLDYDAAMQVTDTLELPTYAGEPLNFELESEHGKISASVPYAPALAWDLDPAGYFWVAPNTADYRVHQVDFRGDTLLTLERSYEPVPVSSAEVDSAVASMTWFTEQGGRIDRSKFPAVKPALSRLFVLGEEYVAVRPVTGEFGSGWEASGSALDLFDRSGRFLGRITLPDGLQVANPEPILRGDALYAVLRDELDVPYVVRYRIGTGPVDG